VIIQDHVLRHVTGHVGSGNMKINEFADIDPTKENDLGFDVIGDMQVFMKNDPMFYRKQY